MIQGAIRVRHYLPQHCLYFLPLPQGHGSLRPTFGPVRTGLALAFATAPRRLRSRRRWLCRARRLAAPSAKSAGVLVQGLLRHVAQEIFKRHHADDALRKMLWQISVLMLTINSSKILNASALYSISGSRWPCARRPML